MNLANRYAAMNPGDAYLRQVLGRHNPESLVPLLNRAFSELHAPLSRWAGSYLNEVRPSGSVVKGTAVLGQTDLDIFVSLRATAEMSLHEIYDSLYEFLKANGLSPRAQDVSIGIKHLDLSIDVTVGRQHPTVSQYHSIYRSRQRTWTQTNVDAHIDKVTRSSRQDEIRLVKIWRHQKRVPLPSFLLEVAVLEALSRTPQGDLVSNLNAIFRYLATRFRTARLVDPANTNNIVSDDLTEREKLYVAAHAALALRADRWDKVVQ